MPEAGHGTVYAERRIRTLLAELPASTRNLGAEIVYSDAFRSGEWPRGQYALDRSDVEALLAELDQLRSLRLARPSEAVDAAVHTPARVIARLRRLGWVREGGADVAELWRHPESGQRVTVSLKPNASDYAKVVGFVAMDLAAIYGVGELQVLKHIAEAGDD